MEIYEKFKELREDRDLTQKDIAQVLNTSPQYYQKYEKGIRPIPTAHIVTLCRFYGVSSDYILGLPKGLNWPR